MTLDHSGKPGLHPRNRHKAGYDFAQLCDVLPELSEFLVTTPAGQTSIEFANPQAVKALNRALLLADVRRCLAGWITSTVWPICWLVSIAGGFRVVARCGCWILAPAPI